MIEVLYFAWLRERLGAPKERIETGAEPVADLIRRMIADVGPDQGGITPATGDASAPDRERA